MNGSETLPSLLSEIGMFASRCSLEQMKFVIFTHDTYAWTLNFFVSYMILKSLDTIFMTRLNYMTGFRTCFRAGYRKTVSSCQAPLDV
jgi:hypothetical protein